MHCRSFRDEDILNILNSSAVGTFNESATTGTTLSKVKLVGYPAFLQSLMSGLLSQSKRGVIAFLVSCYLHDEDIFCMLSRLCERCP